MFPNIAFSFNGQYKPAGPTPSPMVKQTPDVSQIQQTPQFQQPHQIQQTPQIQQAPATTFNPYAHLQPPSESQAPLPQVQTPQVQTPFQQQQGQSQTEFIFNKQALAYADMLQQTRPKQVFVPDQPKPQTNTGPVFVVNEPPPFYDAGNVSLGAFVLPTQNVEPQQTFAQPTNFQPQANNLQTTNVQTPNQITQSQIVQTIPQKSSVSSNFFQMGGFTSPQDIPERPGAPSPSEPNSYGAQPKGNVLTEAQKFLMAAAASKPAPQTQTPKVQTDFTNFIDEKACYEFVSDLVVKDEKFVDFLQTEIINYTDQFFETAMEDTNFDVCKQTPRSGSFITKRPTKTALSKCKVCGFIVDVIDLIESTLEERKTYLGSSLEQIQKKFTTMKYKCQKHTGEEEQMVEVYWGWKEVPMLVGGTMFGTNKIDSVQDRDNMSLYSKPPMSVMQKNMILKDYPGALEEQTIVAPNVPKEQTSEGQTPVVSEAPTSEGQTQVVQTPVVETKTTVVEPTLEEKDFCFARSKIVTAECLQYLFDKASQTKSGEILCFQETGDIFRNPIGLKNVVQQGESCNDVIEKKFEQLFSTNTAIMFAFDKLGATPETLKNTNSAFKTWSEQKSLLYKRDDQFLNKPYTQTTFSEWIKVYGMLYRDLGANIFSFLMQLVTEFVSNVTNTKQFFEADRTGRKEQLVWRECQSCELLSWENTPYKHLASWKLKQNLFAYQKKFNKSVCTIDAFEQTTSSSSPSKAPATSNTISPSNTLSVGKIVITMELDFSVLNYYVLAASCKQDESRPHKWLSFASVIAPYRCLVCHTSESDKLTNNDSRKKVFKALRQAGIKSCFKKETFESYDVCKKWADERGIQTIVILNETKSQSDFGKLTPKVCL